MADYAVWQHFIVNKAGDVLPNAQVEVYDALVGGLAAIYSDIDGAAAISNPFSATSEGLARFYVLPGRYRVIARKGDDTAVFEDYLIGSVADGAITSSKLSPDIISNTSAIYGDVQDGLDNTVEGDYFNVPNPDPAIVFDVYLHDAGDAATLIDQIASQHGIDQAQLAAEAAAEDAIEASALAIAEMSEIEKRLLDFIISINPELQGVALYIDFLVGSYVSEV